MSDTLTSEELEEQRKRNAVSDYEREVLALMQQIAVSLLSDIHFAGVMASERHSYRADMILSLTGVHKKCDQLSSILAKVWGDGDYLDDEGPDLPWFQEYDQDGNKVTDDGETYPSWPVSLLKKGLFGYSTEPGYPDYDGACGDA